ncbi:MAG: glycerate-2-kinase family protein, partial [Acidimicrobiia bacterium]
MTLKLGRSTPEEVAATLKTAHPARTRAVLEMWAAGLAAVEPETAVAEALAGYLPTDGVTIVALGKAAPAMARGAARVLGEQLSGGLVVTDHVEPLPSGVELLLGGHPDPDQSSLEAGQRLLEVVRGTTHRLLFLISGGGSALAEMPTGGLSLDDLVATRRVLQEHGVAIDEMNVVRTHLSSIKGGRLATAANVPFMTVVISDVAGARPHLVASGPTIAGPTKPVDARRVLEQHGMLKAIPEAVIRVLEEAPPPPSSPGGPV